METVYTGDTLTLTQNKIIKQTLLFYRIVL
jgi:hypothetical protein